MKPSDIDANKSVAHGSSRPLPLKYPQRYGLAILSVGVALGTSLLLEHFHFRDAGFPLLLFAVAISSWYGGPGPAVLVVLLSTMGFYWFFVEPVRTIYIYWSEVPYFIIFAAFAVLISWFSTLRRRVEADLRQSRDALQEQASLLNLTHDAVYVRDMKGVIRYWNRGAEVLYGWPSERALGKIAREFLEAVFPLPFEEIVAELLRTGRWEGEVGKTHKDGTQLVVSSRWSLKRDGQGGPVAILVTSNDITERKRAEEALHRLNRELRALSNCNQTLLRATDQRSLLKEICRIVFEDAGYPLAWVSYVEHDEAKTMRPVAWAGTDEAYLVKARISWSEDTDRGRGPTGMAVRSGKTCCVQDFATDARVAPWRETLLQGGSRSAIALPLKDEKANVFGTLTIHCAQPNAFTPEEIRLLEELAGDLAFGIVTLRSRADRKRAEEALRRSEAYLASAQKLTHSGAYAMNGTSREPIYWSEEMFRLFGTDPKEGLLKRDQVWQRIHPEDHDKVRAASDRVFLEKVDSEVEYRIVLPDGTAKLVHTQAYPVLSANGEVAEVVATMVDITERKRAEEERAANLHFFQSMDRVNRAMQGTNDLDQMTGDVIDAMRSVFASDRAFLYYPCDPDAPSFEVVMARTRPEYAIASGVIPMTPGTARGFHKVQESGEVVTFGPGCDYPLIEDFTRRFGQKSSIGIALYPKTGKPWLLAMQQCSCARVWTPDERKLMKEIARRLADSLTSLLMFRNLRESEEALRQSQAYLVDSQRLSHTGSWALDVASGKYDYWSEETYRIFEFDPQDGLPTKEAIYRRVHPEDRTRALAGDEKAIREKVDAMSEGRLALPKGIVKHISVARHPVLNAAGEVVKLVGTTMDITEHKRAEEALRLSNTYNRSLIEASLDPLVTIGPDGNITDVNAATEAATGCYRGELIGTDFCDYFTEPAQARAGYEQVFREGMVRDYPLELRHRSGHVISVLYNASVYRDESGRVVGIFAAARDITEQKRAEEVVRESETRFRTFVDHAPDALFMLEFEQGTIIDVNRPACESLGYSRQELIGKTPLDFDVNLDRATLDAMAERTAAGETVSFDRHWHRRKDGSLFPVEVHLSLFWRGGRRFLLKVARDISERVRAEEALRSSDAERQRAELALQDTRAELERVSRVTTMGALAASIAHEVNQPIAGVVTSANAGLNWLAANPPNLSKTREALERVRRDGTRAGDVLVRIRGLLKRTPPTKTLVSVNQIVNEVLALTAGKLRGDNIETALALDASLPAVLGDSIQLQQVLLNLITNAIEAMAEVAHKQRTLRVQSSLGELEGKPAVIVAVSDTGVGFSNTDTEQLFEAFHTTKPQGMGMGLWISRSIIEDQGGRLTAQANSGQGATFALTIPAEHEVAA